MSGFQGLGLRVFGFRVSGFRVWVCVGGFGFQFGCLGFGVLKPKRCHENSVATLSPTSLFPAELRR